MKFKICTIGCGQLANSHHGPSYLKYGGVNPEVEFSACCDLDPAKAESFAEKFGFRRFYTDASRMLDREKPDAVCLLVPPDITCRVACQVLALGIPVLIEKPPGLTLAEIDQMIDIAERTKTPNTVAFNRRHTPLVATCLEMLHSISSENRLQHIRYDFSRIGRRDADFSTTAIHGIDTVRHLAGCDFAQVRYFYQKMPEYGPNATNIFLQCTMESGATAQINFTPLSGAVLERATLHTHDNMIALDLPIWNAYDYPGRILHIEKGRVQQEITGVEVSGSGEDYILNGFFAENAAFFDAIRRGKTPSGDLKQARQSVSVAQAIRERREMGFSW